MRFGIFYEHQLPRPWAPDDEHRLLTDALEQVEKCFWAPPAGVDQLVFVTQSGRTRHEHVCESLELFAREVMPEFAEQADEHDRAKAERLQGAVEAALARREPPRSPPADYTISSAMQF